MGLVRHFPWLKLAAVGCLKLSLLRRSYMRVQYKFSKWYSYYTIQTSLFKSHNPKLYNLIFVILVIASSLRRHRYSTSTLQTSHPHGMWAGWIYLGHWAPLEPFTIPPPDLDPSNMSDSVKIRYRTDNRYILLQQNNNHTTMRMSIAISRKRH